MAFPTQSSSSLFLPAILVDRNETCAQIMIKKSAPMPSALNSHSGKISSFTLVSGSRSDLIRHLHRRTILELQVKGRRLPVRLAAAPNRKGDQGFIEFLPQ